MTENQAELIGKFIDELPDETANQMFEELIAGMSVYFGTVVFSEVIDEKYDDLKERGKTLEEMANEIKVDAPDEEEIYANLMGQLEQEFDAENFADDCVISISFNPEYPKEIIDKLAELEIEEKDFSANLIVDCKDQFIDFFVNDLDVNEWRNDMIDVIVASWE